MLKNYDVLVKIVKEKGRKLDYYLIKNLKENQEKNILKELLKYQNEDGGFGKGLEPDIRMPNSNVASSDVAIYVLDQIEDEELKADTIKKLVNYYEKAYIVEKKGWELVPKEVDLYPRAIWWNYDNIGNFTYGNPNPEIIGFLFRYQIYLKKLNIKTLVENMIEYLNTDFYKEKSQHSIISSLIFYNKLDDANKRRIKEVLNKAILADLKEDNWEEYALEPYNVFLACPTFMKKKKDVLERNLDFHKKQLEKGLIMPNWEWYQFPEVFEKIKYDWAGFLTFRLLKAVITFDL